MKLIRYKTSVLIFFAALLLLWAILPTAFYIYDPLQLFHLAWGREPTFQKNMRQQAAGVINNFDFDSIIIGTSMLENSSANEASELLGGRFVNISMGGSDHFERSMVLAYALDKRKLAAVIYSLDLSYLTLDMGNPNYAITSYDYLYDDNRFNDLKVYFNDHFLRCLFRWSQAAGCVGASSSLDRPNAWFGMPVHAKRFGGLGNWFSAANSGQVKRALRSVSKAAKQSGKKKGFDVRRFNAKRREVFGYVDAYILSHAKEHPETKFYYVFPPYSRIRFSMLHQSTPLDAALHEEVIRHFVRASSEMDNISVYGYEDQDFPDDIGNYKDPGHHKVEINSIMIHDFKSDRTRIDSQNLGSYLAMAREKALAFDLVGLGNKIDAYLRILAKNKKP